MGFDFNTVAQFFWINHFKWKQIETIMEGKNFVETLLDILFINSQYSFISSMLKYRWWRAEEFFSLFILH